MKQPCFAGFYVPHPDWGAVLRGKMGLILEAQCARLQGGKDKTSIQGFVILDEVNASQILAKINLDFFGNVECVPAHVSSSAANVQSVGVIIPRGEELRQ